MPLTIRPKIMARHMEIAASLAVKHARDGTYPCDPPLMGAKSTTTSNHPSTPPPYRKMELIIFHDN